MRLGSEKAALAMRGRFGFMKLRTVLAVAYGKCHKSKANRRIETNAELQGYPKRARELLLSPQGLDHRSRRPIEPEAVFGQIKANRQLRPFLLRGLDKVSIEFRLTALAHSLMKLWGKGIAERKHGDLSDSGDLILAL